MTVIVNLFGGPGSGKSTLAARVYADLSVSTSLNVELVTEAAKDYVWDRARMDNPIRLFGEQHGRLYRLINVVDVIVTDSPILLSPVYAEYYDPGRWVWLPTLAVVEHRELAPSLNYWVSRPAQYRNTGRNETAAEALAVDAALSKFLRAQGVETKTINGYAANIIRDDVLKRLSMFVA